ncbi:MAG: crossover junction endodeoxyribonuclease RuvC [Rhodospirillaceae bacterium]|jgi:crossover junction endodeoxyribonuclease RuvC|nr:crossover junction endodeoxyribonuclease RuvC [Rhodospirillaceae bacterium]
MKILGLDPGLRTTGWGVIDMTDNQLHWVADGIVCSDANFSLAERLAQLHRGIISIISKYYPNVVAIEEIFINKNPVSTLKLGQARGAALLAASLSNLLVTEYSPRLIKQSLVGIGSASKIQVGLMIRQLLPNCQTKQTDATDALAVAICHAHHYNTIMKISSALTKE